MDFITVTGVRAMGCHGVLEPEYHEPQPFMIDVELGLALREAGTTDDLTQSVSYADIADHATALIQGPHVQLIETLAEKMATYCLTFDRVQQVKVTVHKPKAPLVVDFADVSVTVVRTR